MASCSFDFGHSLNSELRPKAIFYEFLTAPLEKFLYKTDRRID